jgi:ADP-ribose pyrophosphatase YjhB (NUDIX family)
MKIPHAAKKVFQGTIFSVWQWEQEMFDGTIETFEMLKRPNTIEIIATKGDKIFMSRQSQPNKHNYYSLYGGRGEEGEDPISSAKRELLEESGFESSDWELIKSYQPVHKIDWEVYLFVARNCERVAEPKLDSGEKIEELECSFDEFIKIVEHDEYWGNQLVFEIAKMEKNGTLSAFKEKLFSGKNHS